MIVGKAQNTPGETDDHVFLYLHWTKLRFQFHVSATSSSPTHIHIHPT
jgi:hypothetical protein